MDFVLFQNRKPLGPYSADEVRKRIAEKQIDKSAQIWTPPWKSWTSITSVFPSEFGLDPEFLEKDLAKDTSRNRPDETPLQRFARLVPITEIQHILRQAKERLGDEKGDEVRITAKDKEELVFTNVKNALSRGHISEQEIVRAAREIEEVSGQRIFLYRLADDLDPARLGLDVDTVGRKVLGRDWESADTTGFPSTAMEPQCASLRRYAPEADFDSRKLGFASTYPDGWILRIHVAIEERERVDTNSSRARDGTHLSTLTYAQQLRTGVCLLRFWSKAKLLEIRVPNFDRRGAVLEVQDLIRTKIQTRFVALTAFHEWDLTPACTNLLKTLVFKRGTEPTLKSVSGTLLKETDGSTMRIALQAENTAGLLASTARKEAVEEYLKVRSTVESLNACFQFGQDDLQIVAAIAPENKRHEVAVRSISRPGYWDHVIVRLRKNSESNS